MAQIRVKAGVGPMPSGGTILNINDSGLTQLEQGHNGFEGTAGTSGTEGVLLMTGVETVRHSMMKVSIEP